MLRSASSQLASAFRGAGRLEGICQHWAASAAGSSLSGFSSTAGDAQADGGRASSGSTASTSETRAMLAKKGRFYETVSVAPVPGSQQGWQVLLGKYPIKTPARNLLVLPSYPLALAVAAEWEWLENGKPVMHAMPLMGLAATAIDQPKERARVIETLLKYIHTDGACIRYEPGPLQRRQAATFDPLFTWASEALGWRLVATDSIAGATQDEATVRAVKAYLQGLDSWRLAAAEQLTSACKSLLLAAAVLERRLGAAEAVAASRLEEDFQIEDWGMVEAGHDLDIADARSRIGAPALMVQLLPPRAAVAAAEAAGAAEVAAPAAAAVGAA